MAYGKWRFFTDFLIDFAKDTLGRDWGRSLQGRKQAHPFLEWLRLLQAHKTEATLQADGTVFATGAAYALAVFRFAYALYLIEHHSKLPKLLLKRLRNPHTFRPAALETLVVAAFALAGFKVEMGETQRGVSPEGEFTAIGESGIAYSVEAKRKDHWTAGTGDVQAEAFKDELRQWVRQKLYAAARKKLPKPIYWFELSIPDLDNREKALSVQATVREALRLAERELRVGGEVPGPAYVFVTSHCYLADDRAAGEHCTMLEGFHIHMHVTGDVVDIEAALDERDRDREMVWLLKCLERVQQVPHHFDGTPDALVGPNKKPFPRLQVGEVTTIEMPDGATFVGLVLDVVSTGDKAHVVLMDEATGAQRMLEVPLSAEEQAAAATLGDVVFGNPNATERIPDEDPLAIYDFFLNTYSRTPRDKLLSFIAEHPHARELSKLETPDLCRRVCREWAKSVIADHQRRNPGPHPINRPVSVMAPDNTDQQVDEGSQSKNPVGMRQADKTT
ncbi:MULTISPECIES: hypothetical protein [unclassified Sphingomonas]|uniref:hypothetical protein n=1 Tax=unclassified Sphingomonas TaxID=196159 RepID=UPI0021511F58|nr:MULTISPECIES: hypothetical protein [unclassified Sphingomonas]MCR5870712.1 hypothetical protein [Sphingomonas sp. J344]UUY00952.1 hypothetical protein LRS08_07820 [Sphingomonas sp. J315]